MIKSRAAGTADLDGTFSRRYTAARAAACRHDTHVRASETPFAPGLGRFVPYAGAVDAAARVVVRITKGSGAHAAWIPAMCCTWGGASAFPRQPPPRMPPAGGPRSSHQSRSACGSGPACRSGPVRGEEQCRHQLEVVAEGAASWRAEHLFDEGQCSIEVIGHLSYDLLSMHGGHGAIQHSGEAAHCRFTSQGEP